MFTDIYESPERRLDAKLGADLATPIVDNREILSTTEFQPTSILITLEGATCTLYDETMMFEVNIFQLCDSSHVFNMVWFLFTKDTT